MNEDNTVNCPVRTIVEATIKLAIAPALSTTGSAKTISAKSKLKTSFLSSVTVVVKGTVAVVGIVRILKE